jgi:hypothetical protein
MPSERDKTKRWQFGLRESAYFTALLCAFFASIPLGVRLFLLFAPLYLVIFLAVIKKPHDALVILVLWAPFGVIGSSIILSQHLIN